MMSVPQKAGQDRQASNACLPPFYAMGKRPQRQHPVGQNVHPVAANRPTRITLFVGVSHSQHLEFM